jgi:ferritin-like metal-binding protein YciE
MTKVSNQRDLVLQLLAELLFVERRLAGEVLEDLARAVRDEELARLLRAHREETVVHARRLETAFRRAEAAPSANLSRPFECTVAEHAERAREIVDPELADVYHAATALRAEHLEIAAYRALLVVAPREQTAELATSLEGEERAARALTATLQRLARTRRNGR